MVCKHCDKINLSDESFQDRQKREAIEDEKYFKEYENQPRLLEDLEKELMGIFKKYNFYGNVEWDTAERTFYNTQKTGKFKYAQFIRVKDVVNKIIKQNGE